MSILSEHITEPELGKLSNKYTYTRGTTFGINRQPIKHLEERYEVVPVVADILRENRFRSFRHVAGDIITVAFSEMTVDNMLPNHIIPVLASYGIYCDAVHMTVKRVCTYNKIEEIKLMFFCKKSGRERYVLTGCIGIILTSTTSNKHYPEQQEFWNQMINVWKYANSAHISSIFRRKKIVRLSTATTYISKFYKFEQYVITR